MGRFKQYKLKTITSEEAGSSIPVSGGTVLKTGSYSSPNFATGQTGWRLNDDGSAEFTDITTSGGITATSGSIGGFSIGADYLRDVANSFGLASTVSGGDDVRFWAGAAFADR